MNPVLADIIGLLGSACIVGAYAYNNMAARVDALVYNVVNLLGAVMLCISLTVHYNLASLILEFVWSGLALLGIAKALKARRRA
ncbi:CBU_0592 family membrane protein [Rhizorhapis sp. SPR117]|uniref:CBU_0592 family membrane protein n=1 Tax=Rhizorhapis sp. SPR117 TaxID=2912611 RepID=UPI001F2D9765|nr:hypothetical protein [Rhizorhapis sp. SPR117]